MKLMVITKPKDTLAALPPAVNRLLLETTMKEMQKQKKEGKVLEYYYSPAGCSVVILDYKDGDEWVKDQAALPILNHYPHEVYPLADMEKSIHALIESLKKAEALMGK